MHISEDELQIYRDLQEHLDNFPIGFPATESGVEIEILKFFFTPIEAQIATCLNLAAKSPAKVRKRLFDRTGIDLQEDEIAQHLFNMFMKGNIERSGSEEKPKYSNAMLAIGMFEYHVDNMTKEFVENMQKYFDEAFGEEFFRTSLPQLRTSPHAAAIVPEHQIAIYDDMRKFVTNTEKPIQVANCVCKQGEALLGNPCKQTEDIEICLMFGSKSYAARNQAREITKEECLQILDRAEKDGMVLQPGNTMEPFCICICCGCCCGVLTTAKKFEKPVELFATNYFAEVVSSECIGCGVCIKRCQMEAIYLEDKKAIIDLDRCIGCGLCVSTCPTKALKLLKKEKETVPPKNAALLYMNILKEKYGKKKMMMKMFKLLLG
jgi:H+/Na+-translocating ferredoxin:NAD+ oxidoreductase subunit B